MSYWVTGHLILYLRGGRSGEEFQGVTSSPALSLHPRALAEKWWSVRAKSCLPDHLTELSQYQTDKLLPYMQFACMVLF